MFSNVAELMWVGVGGGALEQQNVLLYGILLKSPKFGPVHHSQNVRVTFISASGAVQSRARSHPSLGLGFLACEMVWDA